MGDIPHGQRDSRSQNPSSNPIAGALTYPSSQGGSLQPVPNQPRQPRSIQGLLRFAMEATKAEDAPGNSNLGPMDEERRRFLEQALKSLTVDVVEVLQKAVRTLSDPEKMHSIRMGDQLPDDVSSAFENIMQFVDDIDVANDLYKIGGFSIFPVCLGCEHELVRANACAIIAEVCQNNAFCQLRVLECGILNVLLKQLETEDGTALAKCVHAVSCACREFDPSCQELINSGACISLSRLLQHQHPGVRMKAAFFCTHLSTRYPQAKAIFLEQNLLAVIGERLRQGRDSSSEHLVGLLLALVDGEDPAVFSRASKAYDLKQTIADYLKDPDLATDQFLEEKDLCQAILSKLSAVANQNGVEDVER